MIIIIYHVFKKTITPARIKANSRLIQLADLISNIDYDTHVEPIHVYSKLPGKKQFFFVHTANTGSEAYYLFAKELGDHCGFSAFEQYNLYHQDDVRTTIAGLAEKYIAILKEKQPVGPYCLGGWCFGGMVAFDMAQKLIEAGDSIDSLVLFDSHIIEDETLKERILQNSGINARQYLSTEPLFEGMRKKGMLEALISNYMTGIKAWLTFKPQVYDGKVLYFKAMRKKQNMNDTDIQMYDYIFSKTAGGFEKYIPEDKLTVIPVDSDHDSLMNKGSLDIIMPEFLSRVL